MDVIVSSKRCGSSVVQLVKDRWVLDLGLLLLLTLAKTARANKVADSVAPFMKNLASKMQLMYLVA